MSGKSMENSEKLTNSKEVIAWNCLRRIRFYNKTNFKRKLYTKATQIYNGLDSDNNGYVDDIYGMNGINDSGNPYDDNRHGTHCAGTVSAVADNGQGIAGVAGVGVVCVVSGVL